MGVGDTNFIRTCADVYVRARFCDHAESSEENLHYSPSKHPPKAADPKQTLKKYNEKDCSAIRSPATCIHVHNELQSRLQAQSSSCEHRSPNYLLFQPVVYEGLTKKFGCCVQCLIKSHKATFYSE